MDLQTCGELVLQSLRTDNNIRREAEAKIQEAKEKCPDQLLLSLCLLVKDSNVPSEVIISIISLFFDYYIHIYLYT